MIKKDPQVYAIIRCINQLNEKISENANTHVEKINKMKKLKTELRRVQRQNYFLKASNNRLI